MDFRLHQRDPETIERDKIALRTVADGLHRIRRIAGQETARWRPMTEAEREIYDLADLLENAPRQIADLLSDEFRPRSEFMIDERPQQAAEIIAENRSYYPPEPIPERRANGRHPIARLAKAALLILAGVTTGYLASPLISEHDDSTGIEASYPASTMPCVSTPAPRIAGPRAEYVPALMPPCPQMAPAIMPDRFAPTTPAKGR